MHHRDGGPDPTQLVDSAQQVFHRPTGACHTSRKYPSQPVMGGLVDAEFSQRIFQSGRGVRLNVVVPTWVGEPPSGRA